MKLVFLTPTLSSPAGMERVLYNKVCWLLHRGGYDITIVTTDQKQAPVFYSFPPEVKIIDLGIDYSACYSRTPIQRYFLNVKKRHAHRQKLTELLKTKQNDITIVLYPSESGFVYKIKEGGRKVLEFHSHKYFRLKWAEGSSWVHRMMARYRTWLDARVVSHYEQVLVLTQEDAALWGNLPNIKVVPNAVSTNHAVHASVSESKRVIAVGRLVNQKGFDRLLLAWSKLPIFLQEEWTLDIFGQGPLKDYLDAMIEELGIGNSVTLCSPTSHIFDEYAKSAFLVLSSREEGFGMVLVEAMSVGLPVISFDCPCGPKEIVGDGGILVPNGDINALSEAMAAMMKDSQLRSNLSDKAVNVLSRFSEDMVMSLYESYLKAK